MTLETAKNIFIKAFQGWNKDQVPRLSAALTFYLLLSLSPMLLFLVAATGLLQQSEEFRTQLLQSVTEGLGKAQADLIDTLLKHAGAGGTGIVATILGLLVSLFGASGLFEQLRDSVNAIWGVQPTSRGIVAIVMGKLAAFVMVLAGGAIVVGWVIFDAWLHYMRRHYPLNATFGVSHQFSFPLWQVISLVATWILITPVFGAMFKYLPCKQLTWKDVQLPAFVTGLLFSLGKLGLGLYLSFSTGNASYGSAGAVVVLLLWAYYSAQIFFFGVELTEQYALQRGSLMGEHEEHRNRVLPEGVAGVTG